LNNLKYGNQVDSIPVYNKYGRFVGHEPLYRKLPFKDFSILHTKNTIAVCSVCRGKGKIIHKVAGGYGIVNDCPHCNGTRVMKSKNGDQ